MTRLPRRAATRRKSTLFLRAQTEISQLDCDHIVRLDKEDVLGFDVPVDNVALVQVVYGTKYLRVGYRGVDVDPN